MATRTCTACGESKSLPDFARSAAAKDGYHTWCKACKASRTRQWQAANAERLRADDRAKHAANPAIKREQSKRWYAKHKGRSTRDSRRNWKLRRYGLTLADYDALCAAQDGLCALCGQTQGWARLHDLAVDHNHATGRVRGLLCHKCNVGLGHFEDSVDLLQKAIEYLLRTDGQAERIA